jgi:hypothetical protein
MNSQTCIKCGLTKSKENFDKERILCRICHKENKLVLQRKSSRKHYWSHREQEINRNKRYKLNNIEKLKEKDKKYYESHKDYESKRSKEYHILHKSKIVSNKIKYHKNKRKTNINFRITHNLRGRLSNSIRGFTKSSHTLELLGCSIDHLKQHLQQTAIKNGYLDFDINNYSGHQYNIDHIVPCCAWNLKCSYHQKLCFNWSNMQILSAKDNGSKATQDRLLYKNRG